jgi:hypothetical protein
MFLLLIICHTTDNVYGQCVTHIACFGVCLCISTLLLQDMCSMLSKYNEIDDCNSLFTVPLLSSFSYCVCMHAWPGVLAFFNKLFVIQFMEKCTFGPCGCDKMLPEV